MSSIDPTSLPLFLADPAASEPPAATGLRSTPAGRPQARRLAGAISSPRHAVHAAAPAAGDSAESPAPSAQEDEPAADPSVVRQIQAEISSQLTVGREGRALSAEDTPRARTLIRDEIDAHNQRLVQDGTPALSPRQRQTLAEAVHDALFAMGPLTPLLKRPGLTDLMIRGGGWVYLDFEDGHREKAPPIARGDDELIEVIRRLGETGTIEKPFDRAHPTLEMALPGGYRLSAMAWTSPYPVLTIRRHGYTSIDLEQQVAMGVLSRSLAEFLTAVVSAGRTVVISGLPGAGKTTTSRAVLSALPPEVQIATLETEDELGLHALTDRHPLVWAAQEIPGGGEVVDGRPAGAFTIDDMLPSALRANAQVLVVGEVRGREINAMLDAMQAGQNCVTTVHAENGRDTIERLVTCAVKNGEVSTDWAYRSVASLVDVVVHLKAVDERALGGRIHRYVDEVLLPELSGDSHTGYSLRPLYAPGPDGRAVPDAMNAPAWMDQLVLHGFDPAWLHPARGGWERHLETERGGGPR